jgi:hypothetical protein
MNRDPEKLSIVKFWNQPICAPPATSGGAASWSRQMVSRSAGKTARKTGWCASFAQTLKTLSKLCAAMNLNSVKNIKDFA